VERTTLYQKRVEELSIMAMVHGRKNSNAITGLLS
jgi:hypothetical protein